MKLRKKRDPSYAKAFDSALTRQDASKHVTKAQNERKRKDRTIKGKQRAGFVARRLSGEMGTQAAFISVGLAGAAYLKSPQGQAKVKLVVRKIKFNQSVRKGMNFVEDILNNYV